MKTSALAPVAVLRSRAFRFAFTGAVLFLCSISSPGLAQTGAGGTPQLALSIEAALVENSLHFIRFTAKLTNVGTVPVVLSHTPTYPRNDLASYSDYFIEAIRFQTDPPVFQPAPVIVMMDSGVQPRELVHTLPPRAALTAEWIGECGSLKPKGMPAAQLSAPGLYTLTAHFEAGLRGGGTMRLGTRSQPVTISFGGQTSQADLHYGFRDFALRPVPD